MKPEISAVIQAGGKGTRLRKLTKDDIPKPLLPINGKPMMEWQMLNLIDAGIYEFVFIIGHLGEKVVEYFGDGSKWNVRIDYIKEDIPLGSAGALYYAKEKIHSELFVMVFGDVMFDIDIQRMISFHTQKNSDITLLVHPNSHPYDSDIVVIEEDASVKSIDFKGNTRDYWYHNCVNAGIYILNTSVLSMIREPQKLDLEKDVVSTYIPSKKVYGYMSPEYVKDAGTVERFYSVENDMRSGVMAKKCLKNMQKCIFLDRDGVINQYRGLIADENEFRLEDGVIDAIKMINESGFLAIVVTNQPVIARGMCSIEDVVDIHKKMETLLGEEGVYLDAILFCPHHPDKGFPEENPVYKIPCHCRKPDVGMLEEARERFNINMEGSWIVGDTTVDIQTGVNAGIKTALVLTGMRGDDGKYIAKPDIVGKDLVEVVQKIIQKGEKNELQEYDY